MRPSTEQEGAQQCPLPTAPEETVVSPIHPPVKHYTIALAKSRIILDRMNDKIIKCLNKILQLHKHNENTKESFKKSNNISKIDTVLQTEYGINDIILENTVIIPLSECIDAHHRKLQNKVSMTIKECIQNAHRIIINDPALHCRSENMEDTINNAITYWQHTLNKNNDTNNKNTTGKPIMNEKSKTCNSPNHNNS